MIGSGEARVSDDRKPDPRQDAERRLRQGLAAEARTQRDQLGKIQKGFYGCVGLLVLVFLALLFLS